MRRSEPRVGVPVAPQRTETPLARANGVGVTVLHVRVGIPEAWTQPTSAVIPSYTQVMKTAISVSDETFQRVSRTASELGMSRSEFFARAAQRYLDELDAQSLTVQIDSALERLDGTDEAEAAAVAIGHRVLDAADDEW